MKDVLLFAILGTGAGAVYAMIALGIVLIQKGTGAVNFAQGAIAGACAIYFGVSTGNNGTPLVQAALTAIVTAGLGGLLFYVLVMRPLRNAPLLARIVTTLGLMLAVQGLASQVWKVPTVIAPAIFPTDSIDVFGINFGADRLYLLGTAILLTVVLWAVYRFTRFGMATRAVAENEQGAALLGYSPDVIGAANWMLGSMLAALAGVLFAPITALNISTLSLLVVPALAAALVGRLPALRAHDVRRGDDRRRPVDPDPFRDSAGHQRCAALPADRPGHDRVGSPHPGPRHTGGLTPPARACRHTSRTPAGADRDHPRDRPADPREHLS
ncbi:branched-chain amino acid ABC transporter permease [Aeromicrobium sp. UC242_57]|uniref:branched-chain amino acid ABC transporter permease n=1 Tax=Aeromicrobium sp. UC242_57 TaxID=3374624 RepID=UPI00378FF05D